MSFSPTYISSGGISTLSITIYNPNTFPLILSSSPDPAWTNILDEYLDFADPVNITTDCGGSVSAIDKTLMLIGGVVPAKDGLVNGQCTVSVDVTSTHPGNIPNSIPADTLKATNEEETVTVTNPTPASIDLLVNSVQPPSLSMSFSPNTMWVGNTSRLTITLRNNDANTALENVSIANNLPANVVIAATPDAVTTCGGSVTADPGGSSIQLTGGSIPVDSSCTVRVYVTSATAGVYTNQIPASAIQTQQGVTNAGAASAPLNVQAIGIAKAFSPSNFQEGNTSTLTITLQNPTASDYHGASITDTLPAGLVIASAPAATQCGGSVTYTSGSITLTGGVIPAGSPGNCTITAQVSSSTPASYTNTIPAGALTTTEGASNVIPATANISVYRTGGGVSASKGFNPSPIGVGGRSQMTINVTAPADTALHDFALTDSLPSGLSVDDTPASTTSGCGSATFTPAAGDTLLRLTGGTILAGATCSIRVYVTSDAPGSYTNTISPANISNTENRNVSSNFSGTLTVSGLSVSKLFMPDTVNPEGISTLSIILVNDNYTQLDAVSFSDVLPATDASNGIFVAPQPHIETTCGSVDDISVSTNGSGIQTISMAGGVIPARVGSVAGTCTVNIDVVGKGASQTYTNRIASGAVSGTIHGTATTISNPSQASADLGIQPLSINVVKSFAPEMVSAGSASTMTIILANPNEVALAGIQFTDNFPVPDPINEPARGMKVATPAVFSTGDCGGTITAEPGETSFSYSGGYLAANSTCALTVQVTMNVNSNLTNTLHAGDVTTINGASNAQDVSATLTNQPAASVSKMFGLNPINAGAGNSSPLTITIQNLSNFPLTGVGLVDTLPAGMTATDAPTTTCADGTVSEVGGVITLSGAQLADLSSCTIDLHVTAPDPGSYQNCVEEETLINDQNATNATAACDTLEVLPIPDAPGISKVFSPDVIASGGVTTLTFTLTNPNDVALEDVTFSDLFPAGLSLASVPNAAQCGGTVSSTSGSITLSGGTLAANASCTVTAAVTSTTGGEHTNTSGAIGWTYNETTYSGGTATDVLTVVAPPAISKSFSPDAIIAGGSSTLTFTISNPVENTVALSGVGFSDTFPTGLSVASAPAAAQCGGTVSSTSDSISLSGGSIAVGGSCTVTVDVTAPGGSYANVSGAVTSTNGGVGNTAADTLTVSGGGLLLDKTAVSASFQNPGDSIAYRYELTNTGTIPLYGTGMDGVFMLSDDKIGSFACNTTTTSLAPGASVICDEQSYTTLAGDVDARLVTNSASATAYDQEGTGNLVTSNTDSATVRLAAVTIDKRTSTAGYRNAGDIISYTFTITNTGDVPLYGAGPGGVFIISDDLIGEFTCHASITSLAPGANLACTGTHTYTVTSDDLTAGSVTNHALTNVQDQASGGTLVFSNEDSVQVYMIVPPTISKAFSPDTIPAGGVSSLVFTLTNPTTNAVPLTGVGFEDVLPEGVEVAGAPLAAQCGGTVTATDDTITLTGGTIIADAGGVNNHCTVTVNVTAGAAGSYDNTSGAVTSGNGGTGLVSNTATLTVIAPPLITKAFSPARILPGEDSTITFTLTNPNSAAALSGVAFEDDFPANLVVADPPNTSLSGCGGMEFLPSPTAPAQGDAAIALGSGSIAAGGTCTITIDVTATAAGTKYNTTGAVSSSEGGEGATSNTAALYVDNPHLTLEKSITSGDLYRAVGDTISYSYLLTNDGNVTLIGAGLNGRFSVSDDQIDGGAAFLCPAAPAGLAPGDTLTCTASYTVTQADLDYGSVTNTAQAFGKYGSTAVNTNLDDATARAAPVLTKALTSTSQTATGNTLADQAAIGELATYTLNIIIPKGSSASASLTDLMDAGLSFVDVQSVTLPAGVSSANAIGTGSTPANVAITDASGGVDNRLVFNFGNITNANTDYSVQETIAIVYRAQVQNISDNQAGTSLDNQASFAWASDSVDQKAATSAITVVEPTLTLAKEQTSSGSDAGDLVSFRITVSNGSEASDTVAYEAAFSDVIPTGLTYSAGSAAVSAVPGECSAGAPASFDYDSGSHTLSAVWAAFEPGASCIFTYETTISASIYPGQSIAANTADLRWTSLPGSASGERTGSDGVLGGGTLNDYRLTDSTDAFSASNVAAQKALVSTSEAHTSGTNAAIGEVARFRLVMQLPESTVANLHLLDSFSGTGGQRFIDDGSARVLFVGGGGVTSALYGAGAGEVPAVACANYAGSFSLAEAADPAVIPSSAVNCALADANISSAEASDADAYATNGAVYFKAGTISNADSDANAEYVIVEYNALVTNEAVNVAGDTLINSFRARHDSGGMTNLGLASGSLTLNVVEPDIPFSTTANNKTVSPTSGDAGDEIEYTLTYTAGSGAGDTDAYNVRLVDDLSALPVSGLSFSTGDDLVLSGCAAPGTPEDNSTLTAIDLTLPHVSPGCTVTLNYRVTLAASVAPQQTITNTARLTYTSLPGEQGTGSATPGLPGTPTGERTGSGTAPNTYTGADTAAVTVSNVAAQKALVSTSEAHTSGTNAAIGEVARFRLVLQLPESTIANLHLLDSFSGTGGQRFIDDGSARVLFVGGGGVTSALYGAGAGEVPAVACANYAGSFSLAEAADPAVIPSSAVNCALADANISSAEASDADAYATNGAVYFKAGTISNADSDANAEYVIVEYNSLVTNEAVNVAGDTLINSFRARHDSGGMTNLGLASGSLTLNVVEPSIPFNGTANNKTVTSSTSDVDAGDAISYQIVYTNSGGADAFEVAISDDLSALPLNTLTYNSTVFNASCTTPGTPDASGSDGTHLSVIVPRVQPGCQVTITYTATATAAVSPGQTITNEASIFYTSLPGGQGTGSATPGASGEETGERTGSGTAPNSYTGTDTASVTTRTPVMTKTLTATELTGTDNLLGEAVIGELLTYRLVISVPEGVTPALRVVDTLDSGLAFVDCLSVSASSGVSTDLAGGFADACLDGTAGNPAVTSSGGVATYTLGTVSNSNTDNGVTDTITIDYTVIALNQSSSQAGTPLNNSAVVSWTGGSGTAVSAENVAIIEPTLTIVKTRTVTGDDRGDTTTFRVVVSNGNAASDTAAHEVIFSDTIPDGLTYTADSAEVSATPGECTAGAPSAFNYDSGTSTLTATWDSFAVNTSCTFTFDTTLDSDVYPGQTIAANTGVVQWTSLSGTRSDYSSYNTASDERTGADGLLGGGTLNDYRETGSVVGFNVNSVAVQKALAATSEAHTNGANVTIGEIARYRLVLQAPEGEIDNLQLLDSFGGAGSQLYLDDASARVLFVGDGGLTSSLYGTGAGEIPAVTCANYAGSFSLAEAANPAVIPSTAVDCALADANISSAEASNADGYAANTPVYFKPGTISNTDSDANAEFIIVEFNALVTNETANQAGDVLTNAFTARGFTGGSMQDLNSGASNSVSLTIVEPSITDLAKTASTVNDPPDAGDTVTYTITFSNTGAADAREVRIVDDLASLPLENLVFDPDTDLTYTGGTCTAPGTVTNASDADTIDVTIANISATCQAQIVFTADITSGAAPGEEIDNEVDLTYTSLPGSGSTGNATGSDTPGPSGAESGERSGSGTAPNTYLDTDSAALTLNGPALVKSIVSTSETHTSESGDGSTGSPRLAAVGEIVRFRLAVNLPEGTSSAFTVSDVLPAGLSYLGNPRLAMVSDNAMTLPADLEGADQATLPPTFALPAGRVGVVGQTVTFSLGDLVNQDADADVETVAIEFNALVRNVTGNDNGVTLDNTFSLSIAGSPAGTSGAVRVELVEPVLLMAKSASADTGWAYGDTVTYTVDLTSDAASTADAFDLLISDTIPAGLTYVDGSITAPALSGWVADDSNAPDLSWSCSAPACSLAAQGSASFTYQVTVNTPADPAYLAGTDTVDNTASLTWTSLPGAGTGANVTGSVTPGASGAADGERDGSAALAVDDYAASDTHSGGLVEYYAIGNRVWEDENNNGAWDTGEGGINGVEVELFAASDTGFTSLLASDITEDGGYFLFDHLLAGDYVVRIPGGNFTSGSALEGYWSSQSALNADGSTRDETTPADPDNDTDQVDDGMWLDPYVVSNTITLGPTGASEPPGETDTQPVVGQGDHADGYANMSLDFGFFQIIQLSGTVWYDIDASGAQNGSEPGISGAVVTVTWAGPDGDLSTSADNVVYPGITTGADGAWSLQDMAPGLYRAVVTNITAGLTQQTYDLDGVASADQAEFTISAGVGRSDVDFGYRGAGSLGDFVWFDVNRDGVQNPGEPGLPGASITLTWAGQDGDLAATADNVTYSSAVSDASGVYGFDNLPGGVFRMDAVLPGSAPITMQNQGGDDASDSDFDPLTAATGSITLADEGSDQTIDLGAVLYSIDKAASATSFSPTIDDEVTIGEVVTYDLTLALSEGASDNVEVVDSLPAGMEYVDGSASLVLTGFDGSAALSGVTTASNQVTFDLGTVTVNSGAGHDNHFILRFNALVVDAPGNSGIVGSQTTLSNTATLQVDGGELASSNSVDLLVVEPQLTLEKTFDPTLAELGDTVTIQLVVENTGTSPAFDVIISDPLLNAEFTSIHAGSTPAGFTFSTSAASGVTTVRYTAGANVSIAAGGSLTFTFTAVVASSVTPGTTLTNTASITQYATQPSGYADRRIEPQVSDSADLDTSGSDLSIAKTDTPDPVMAGENLAYTLVVQNHGPYTATQVRVEDTLPQGVSFVSAGGDGGHAWSCAYTAPTRLVACDLASLDVDDTTTITLVVAVSSGATGTLQNTAAVSGELLDPDPSNNEDTAATTVNTSADLVIEKTALSEQFAGMDLVYTLEVSNNGPSDAAGVTLSDPLPAGVSLVTVTHDSSHAWSCAGTTSITCGLASLTAGDSTTITVTVRIAVDTIGVLSNTGTVTAQTTDPDPDNNESTVATDVLPAPYLTASKLAAEIDSNNLIVPGEELEYTIVVTNTGLSDAESVVFSDTPGANTSLVIGTVTSSAPGGIVISGNTAGDDAVTVNLGDLPALTGTATITFRVRIAMPFPAGVDSVSNQGVFTGDNFQDVTTDNHTDPDNPGDPTVTPVTVTPQLSAVKSVTVVEDADLSLSASPGDTLGYTITITNSGDADDASVIFSDPLDPNTTLVVGSVSASQGTVTLGNHPGDSSVAVAIGTLTGAGGQATISLRVTINHTLPAGTTSIANQGLVTGLLTDIVTDDPEEGGNADVTVTPLVVPTAVSLLSFTAQGVGNHQIRLAWSTAVETDNYGFALKRAAVEDYSQAVEIGFVASAVPGGSGGGAAYEFIDTPPQGGVWFYWLVDVDNQGRQVPHQQTVSAAASPGPGFYLYLPVTVK